MIICQPHTLIPVFNCHYSLNSSLSNTKMAENIRKLLRDERQLTKAATASFMEIDIDRSGKIDESEVLEAMKKVCTSLGASVPTKAEIKELMKRINTDKTGTVSFDEYLAFLKITLKKHLEKVEGRSEEDLRNSQRKDDKLDKKVRKQISKFEKYLEDCGIPVAFEVIYTEILEKKIEPDQMFMYAAMRLRQIGKQIAHLLPRHLTGKGS